MDTVIYILLFLTVTLVAASIGIALFGRDRVAGRIIAENVSVRSDQAPLQSLQLTKERKRLDSLLAPFKERLRQQEETGDSAIESTDLMKAAGFYSPRAGTLLYAIRFTLAIVLSSATASILLFAGADRSPLMMMLTITALGAGGYYLPLLYVRSRARERQRQFSDGLPDALDLILICLEAGLTFPAALQYIAKEFRDVHPVIAENFEIVNLEFRAGRRRADALKNLSRRVDLVELTSIVNMVNQSDVLGTSLTRAIRTAAVDLRRDRMLKAEEKANALPAKMSLVLTSFVFPIIMGVILIPIMMRFLGMDL